MPNVRLSGRLPLSPARKVALGTWTRSGDPTITGTLRLDATAMVAWLTAARARTGRRITVTHIVAKLLADTLAEHPEVNVRLRLGGIHQRADVAVFVHVALRDPETGQLDLSGAILRDADQKSLLELIDDADARIARVRAGTDTELEKGRDTFRLLPGLVVPPLVRLLELLSVQLNLDLRFMGVARDPFGSVLLTNIGALGLDEAWAPLVPYSGVPIVVALGALRDTPLVRDGEVVVVPVLPLYATLDHRVLDGAHAAKLARSIRRRFADPAGWLGDPNDLPASALPPNPAIDPDRGGGA